MEPVTALMTVTVEESRLVPPMPLMAQSITRLCREAQSSSRSFT